MPRKLTVTARTIFPPPHKAQIVSQGESQGRHLQLGTVKLDLWRPWMHLNFMHPVTSENRFHCTVHQTVDTGTGGGYTRKHDRRARRRPKGQLPCILDRQRSATDLARSRSVRIGGVRFEKMFGRQPVR